MDVLVVGAGITGASCAYHLARRGARVRVVERAPLPATGSTGRSAAGLRHQYSHPENVRMSLHSAAALRAFGADVGGEPGYRTVGYLFLLPEGDMAAWSEQRAMQRRLGARVEPLDTATLERRFPYLALGGVAAGSFGPDDGVVDPHGITLGYLAAARRLGAEVHFDAEVVELRRRRGRWRARTGIGVLEGDVVVNAAGPTAAAVSALAGVALPVTPSRRNVYLTAPLDGLPHPTPLIVDVASGVYLRSEGRRVLFGLSNPDETPAERLDVDWSWLETVLERALPRFPFLEHAALDQRACWAGLYAMTPDHLPVLGRCASAEGLAHACGFSGHGVQHAPATGLIIAEEVVDGRCASFDLRDFRLERFEGKGVGRTPGMERNVV